MSRLTTTDKQQQLQIVKVEINSNPHFKLIGIKSIF